jgi:putative OPT family oligopeptide transporter
MKLVLTIAAVAMLPLLGVSYHFTGSPGIAVVMAIFMLVAGFLFSAVAAYMAGLVGSSNNPISGVTIATVLTSSLILVGLGMDGKVGPAAAIFIGAVVCCGAAIGGDNMQDLKAGHLLGSTPRNQQIMQVIGVVAAVLVMAPVLNLLHTAYTIGSDDLSAPQATLMKAVASGVFSGDLPWTITAIGAGLAIVIIIIDLALERAGSEFRMPVLAYAVGIYLPMETSAPIFLGGLLAYAVNRGLKGRDKEERASGVRKGMLFAAGLITGEALVGILLAIPIAITADKNVLSLFDPKTHSPMAIPGIVLLAGAAYLLYSAATKRD